MHTVISDNLDLPSPIPTARYPFWLPTTSTGTYVRESDQKKGARQCIIVLWNTNHMPVTREPNIELYCSRPVYRNLLAHTHVHDASCNTHGYIGPIAYERPPTHQGTPNGKEFAEYIPISDPPIPQCPPNPRCHPVRERSSQVPVQLHPAAERVSSTPQTINKGKSPESTMPSQPKQIPTPIKSIPSSAGIVSKGGKQHSRP